MEAFTEAKKAYSKLKYKADSCTSCGVCIPKCPYGIDIISKLEYTHFKLTDEWVKQRT
ncbi:MAG: 4Fe-4S dicluster domain-containing protein [Spirochaetales bacterium]|nr:4Fe-4S dicluster domain-containing protein [Spirochaetales bacterium]